MSPKDVKKYYGSTYNFNVKTEMSSSSLMNWLKWGYVPYLSQIKIERLTNGDLKAEDWRKNESE
jgi:hypothetical protein